MRRLLYLGYYLKKLDGGKFRRFFRHVQAERGWSSPRLASDVLQSVFRHNVDLLDYFYFRFYDLDRAGRSAYAGTGFMYEYQRKMNPPGAREALADKRMFLRHYRPFVRRKFGDLDGLRQNPALMGEIVAGKGNIVVKNARGQVGAEVQVWPTKGLTRATIIQRMEEGGFDLAEE